MIQFKNHKSKVSSNVTESFTFYQTNLGSRSGLYLFNPRSKKETVNFSSSVVTYFEEANMMQILQVFQKTQSIHVLKTFIVYKNWDSELMSQLSAEIQTSSSAFIEMSYSLKLSKHSENSDFRAYTDDSLKIVQRPINNGKYV